MNPFSEKIDKLVQDKLDKKEELKQKAIDKVKQQLSHLIDDWNGWEFNVIPEEIKSTVFNDVLTAGARYVVKIKHSNFQSEWAELSIYSLDRDEPISIEGNNRPASYLAWSFDTRQMKQEELQKIIADSIANHIQTPTDSCETEP